VRRNNKGIRKEVRARQCVEATTFFGFFFVLENLAMREGVEAQFNLSLSSSSFFKDQIKNKSRMETCGGEHFPS
jgi:hypothetical protein